MRTKLSLIIVFARFIVLAFSYKYLTETPKFLELCSVRAPNFNDCFKSDLQALIINLKNGIPGLPESTKLEPVSIKRIKIRQNQLKIEVNNAYVRGLSATNLTNVIVHPKQLKFLISAVIPKLRLDAHYKVAGSVALLPLHGNGTMWLEAERLRFSLILKMQLQQRGNLTFAHIQSVRSRIEDIGDLRLHLANLFNDNAQLATQANALFNENWRSFIEVLRPTVQDTLDAIVLMRLRKVFRHIPVNYFITDITTNSGTQN